MRINEHPAADGLSPGDRRTFLRLQFFRLIIASAFTLFLARVVEFGLSTAWLIAAVTCALFFSGHLVKKKTAFVSVLLVHSIFFLSLSALFWLANLLLTSLAETPPYVDFLIPRIADNVLLVSLFYVAAFLSSWFFWTRPRAVTFEALFGSALFVWLLSGHRNYHIDSPRQVSSLTWKVELLQRWRIEPQHLLLGLGTLFVIFVGFYLAASNNRPIFGKNATIKSYGNNHVLLSILCPLLLLFALIYFTMFVNNRYAADLSRVANGVGIGENLEEGQSPLGFHSAISPTRQPAALVRMESDYPRNPWSPMLYLREGSLSAFNGRELVKAGTQFDTDVPNIRLGQSWRSMKLQAGPNRDVVIQSIYIITNHRQPFALDIPRQIAVLKNPYPERFRIAYQVLSHAPVKSWEDLIGVSVGDSSWDKKTWEHYLRAPGSSSAPPSEVEGMLWLQKDEPVLDKNGEDLRYGAMANALAGASNDKIAQSASIARALSEKSIYTRNPGHKVSKKGDPVAPYLFADEKRGYCVHFAHAAVYMLRLLEIPARIATGYLIDLTYAKDGHILLHLGDRHAWPEVYVEGHGWVVFDITPARAENEPTLIPDEKLLEELMSKLDPAQTLVDMPPLDLDESDSGLILVRMFSAKTFWGIILSLLLALITFKIALRSGYRFSNNHAKKVRLAYIAFASLMADLRLYRNPGETRQEYASRLRDISGVDAATITLMTEKNSYGKSPSSYSNKELSEALEIVSSSYDTSRSRWKRIVAFFSPFSLPKVSSW